MNREEYGTDWKLKAIYVPLLFAIMIVCAILGVIGGTTHEDEEPQKNTSTTSSIFILAGIKTFE